MPRRVKKIEVDLLPIEVVDGPQPCPWVRATQMLLRKCEELGLLNIDDYEGDNPAPSKPVKRDEGLSKQS